MAAGGEDGPRCRFAASIWTRCASPKSRRWCVLGALTLLMRSRDTRARARGARSHGWWPRERVDDPNRRRRVETHALTATAALHGGRGGRTQTVGRHGGDDDAVHRRRRDPAAVQASLRRGHREVGGATAGGEAALDDTGARANPLVGGVEPAFEIGVRIDIIRHVVTARCDRRPHGLLLTDATGAPAVANDDKTAGPRETAVFVYRLHRRPPPATCPCFRGLPVTPGGRGSRQPLAAKTGVG